MAAIKISAFKGVRSPDAKLHWEGYDQVAERAYAAYALFTL